MTITSENLTQVQLPEADHRAGRSDVTWTEDTYKDRLDPSPESRHRRSARGFIRLVALLAAGALCVGMLALTASSSTSSPTQAATTGAAAAHPRVAVATAPTGTARPDARPDILQCASGPGTKAAQRLLLPLLPTFPCAVAPATETGNQAAGSAARPR